VTAHSLLIAVTGYGQESERRRAFEAGFDEHLIKPAEPARLNDLIARWRENPPAPDAQRERRAAPEGH
jgi:CheY-like chemotaxis protein